ncbi:MAG: transporter substrate-binding domain-containing protein [Thermoanaerobaculia bacterium]|nr:transporter substrate-binding domain-containing protein [Thermoanaerobaculia bacterium]
MSKIKALIGLLVLSLIPLGAQGQPLRVLAYETSPFFFLEEGEPAGLEYEILDYFAKAEGGELDIVWMEDFDEILPTIAGAEADLAAATITVTPERDTRVDFSTSYFPVRVVLVEPESRRTGTLEELRGETLATMTGTTYEDLLQDVPEAGFVYGDTERELFELVSSGQARALAVDSAVAFTLVPEFPSLQITLPLSEEQHYAFATPEGSPLAGELSRHIRRMKQSRIYYRLLEKYFGEEAREAVMSAKDQQ